MNALNPQNFTDNKPTRTSPVPTTGYVQVVQGPFLYDETDHLSFTPSAASQETISALQAAAIKHAPDFLEDAVKTMRQRAALRDAPATGERSMAKTVAIFNAWTGGSMSVQDGWRFMIALKQAREVQGFYNEDDYVDGAAYVALLGEEESGNKTRTKP